MYVAYHNPSCREFFFICKPLKKDLKKVFNKYCRGESESDFSISDFDVEKIKFIDNYPED